MRQAFTALLAIALLGCAGSAARKHELLPGLRIAWRGISVDIDNAVRLGVAAPGTGALQSQMDVALKAGDSTAIGAVPLDTLGTAVASGVEARTRAGEISAGVGDSLLERWRQFRDGVNLYLRSPR